jgi:hypothetical protein
VPVGTRSRAVSSAVIWVPIAEPGATDQVRRGRGETMKTAS